MRAIYKICTVAEWADAEKAGWFKGSAIDHKDGFIHFSTCEQIAETAAKYFAVVGDLVLVKVDADRLGPNLIWEPARGGSLFPHLYGPLDAAMATWVKDLPDGEARAVFLARLPSA
jgi:uncharacterized protein (DUF952 family)